MLACRQLDTVVAERLLKRELGEYIRGKTGQLIKWLKLDPVTDRPKSHSRNSLQREEYIRKFVVVLGPNLCLSAIFGAG